MATKNTKSKSEAALKTAAEKVVVEETVQQEEEEVVVETKEEKKRYMPKQFNLHEVVTVRNGFHGKLVFVAKSNEVFTWEEFGDEQEIELLELKNACATHKQYFINNWFMFDDPEVVAFLKMNQYYKYALKIEEFDDLFTKTPGEIEEILSKLSKGQKHSVGYRAKQLIADGTIDSFKVIETLERCLDKQLIER